MVGGGELAAFREAWKDIILPPPSVAGGGRIRVRDEPKRKKYRDSIHTLLELPEAPSIL